MTRLPGQGAWIRGLEASVPWENNYCEVKFNGLEIMGLEINIEKKVLMWVTSFKKMTDNQFAADGYSFDGSFGFGYNAGGHLLRNYEGRITLINVCGGRERCEGSIGLRHSMGSGLDWVIKSRNFPNGWQPPFLLTARDEIRFCVQGMFDVQLNAFGQEVEADTWIGPIPVNTPDGAIMGILEDGKIIGSKLTGRVTAFSNGLVDENNILGASLCLSDPEEIFGVLKSIS